VTPAQLGDGGYSHGGFSHGGFEETRESFGVGENNQATTVSGGHDRERERAMIRPTW